jgi:hypothetical protein
MGAPIEWEDWGPGMHREAARSEIKLSEATREGLPARGRKKPGDPVEPIPASDLRPDMVETKNLPVNLLYPPKVVVRVDGTVGISPPHRGNYIGPPWCSIEVDSAALRQACPKPLIAREPATPGGAGAEPPLDSLIEVLKEMYPPNGDVFCWRIHAASPSSLVRPVQAIGHPRHSSRRVITLRCELRNRVAQAIPAAAGRESSLNVSSKSGWCVSIWPRSWASTKHGVTPLAKKAPYKPDVRNPQVPVR